jgi:hypothetical protein
VRTVISSPLAPKHGCEADRAVPSASNAGWVLGIAGDDEAGGFPSGEGFDGIAVELNRVVHLSKVFRRRLGAVRGEARSMREGPAIAFEQNRITSMAFLFILFVRNSLSSLSQVHRRVWTSYRCPLRLILFVNSRLV